MSKTTQLQHLAQACRKASRIVAQLDTSQKNKILADMADQLLAKADFIISENKKDVDKAKENGLSDALIDRLLIDQTRLQKIAAALRDEWDRSRLQAYSARCHCHDLRITPKCHLGRGRIVSQSR